MLWGGAGVELRGFAGFEDEFLVSEDEAEVSVEDVDPFVAVTSSLAISWS